MVSILLFPTVMWVGMQCVSEAFYGQTHLHLGQSWPGCGPLLNACRMACAPTHSL